MVHGPRSTEDGPWPRDAPGVTGFSAGPTLGCHPLFFFRLFHLFLLPSLAHRHFILISFLIGCPLSPTSILL